MMMMMMMGSSSIIVPPYNGRPLSRTSKHVNQMTKSAGHYYLGPFPPARIVVPFFVLPPNSQEVERDLVEKLVDNYQYDNDFHQRWRSDHHLRKSYDPVFTDMEIELSSVERLIKDRHPVSAEVHSQYQRLLFIENAMINRVHFSLFQKSYIDKTYHFFTDEQEANAVMECVCNDLRTMLDIVRVWNSHDADNLAELLQNKLTEVDGQSSSAPQSSCV